MTEKAPVVVGVDGSASALGAVRLATREAARRGRTLRIVHANVCPLIYVDVDPMAVPEVWLRHDADRLMAEAAATARSTDADIAVNTEIITGRPSAVMEAEARNAAMVVLGDRGLGGFTGLLLGSIAVRVTSHSKNPVLVARGEEHPGGPIVLGVDESEVGSPAIEAAFAAAEQRGAELLAVRVWTEPLTTTPPVMPVSYDADIAEEAHALAGALVPYRKDFPTVRVREKVMSGPPGRTLIRLSESAQLMVVGTRGRGGFTGLLLGSVSQQVLHHASCPVMLVPRGGHSMRNHESAAAAETVAPTASAA